MTDKIVRGNLLVFTSTPRDAAGAITSPDSVNLYLNYKHADGTTSTDAPLAMDANTDGTWTAEFDTKVCEAPTTLFASIRAVNPSGADDIKINIIANTANPDP